MKAKEIFMYGLAALATLVFLVLVIMVFIYPIPDTNKETALFLLGQFAGIVVMVYSYFFGSSKGSADKTETVNRAAEELARNSVIKTTEQINTQTN